MKGGSGTETSIVLREFAVTKGKVRWVSIDSILFSVHLDNDNDAISKKQVNHFHLPGHCAVSPVYTSHPPTASTVDLRCRAGELEDYRRFVCPIGLI